MVRVLPRGNPLPSHELKRRVRGVVFLPRRQVRKDFRFVDAAPPEVNVRELVGLVPPQLVRDERVQAGEPEDLRQARGEAEGVGEISKPLRWKIREVLTPEPIRVQDLAHERLAGWKVAIGLHPKGTQRLPAALGHALADLLEELR